METKEVKIQIPEGYEIDKENSTFECIKFKSIKKNITYGVICEYLFKDKDSFYITNSGGVNNYLCVCSAMDKNNATNRKQLTKVLALNQLLNIAEYYNRLHSSIISIAYTITYDSTNNIYYISTASICGIKAIFNRKEDAQAVIDNPNFREILDAIYK